MPGEAALAEEERSLDWVGVNSCEVLSMDKSKKELVDTLVAELMKEESVMMDVLVVEKRSLSNRLLNELCVFLSDCQSINPSLSKSMSDDSVWVGAACGLVSFVTGCCGSAGRACVAKKFR